MRLIVAILCAVIGLSSGAGVLPDDSLNAQVGNAYYIQTSLVPTETPLSFISWSFGSRNIVTYVNGTGIDIDPEYEDRLVLFIYTGTLLFRLAAVNESGVYNVSIIPTAGDAAITGFTTLTVYEPVRGVTVKTNNTYSVEFNDTVRFSCSASGSSLSFFWLNGSVEVTAGDRVQITDGGTTLTIASVLRYDQGLYTCVASNPVTSHRNYATLFVNYGPENVNLTKSPPAEFHVEGSDVFLSCSADSRRRTRFRYFFNGERVSVVSGSQLRLWNIQMDQSGTYSCQAFNPDTGRITTSPLVKISVSGPGLSTGAIVGIVIAALAVVAGAVILLKGVFC